MIKHSPAQEALRNFYLRTQRMMDRLSAVHGTSSARLRVMMHIASQGSARFVDLVEAFGFAPRTITDAIDALEMDGLVERRPDAVDRRVKRISLTPAGEAVLKAIEPVRQQFIDQLFGALGEQEREQLTTFLGRLNQRLQELEEDFQEQTHSVLVQPVTRPESD
jgi:DNA-binding MarR family transcriptional regulator